jgi:hypothetical protein
MADQQRAFDAFRADYNEHRPHEALGMKTPASHYEPSGRPMPERPREPEYAEGFVVRRVNPSGALNWLAHRLPIGRLLASQPLGLRQVDNDEWELFYGPLLIGYVLARDGKPRIEPVF